MTRMARVLLAAGLFTASMQGMAQSRDNGAAAPSAPPAQSAPTVPAAATVSAPASPPAAPAAPAVAPRPAARPADVASVDAIIAALYDVVSGPAGGRDWDRMRSLFAPDARLGAIGARKAGGVALRGMTVEDYIVMAGKNFSQGGFFEYEVARTSDTFGELVHVFSTYEAKRALTDAQPFLRGINSVQLYHDGSRWYLVSLLWRAEDDKLKLPERYMKKR